MEKVWRPRPEEELYSRLVNRDWKILDAVGRFRLMTGEQIEKLFFSDISDGSRARVRRRVLARLVTLKALTTVPPRYAVKDIQETTGNARTRLYTLHRVGKKCMVDVRGGYSDPPNIVRSFDASDRFIPHVLAVTELYVRTVEAGHVENFEVRRFYAEPNSWRRVGRREWLKPDAYTILHPPGSYAWHWWIEIDRGTESLPVLNEKFRTYLHYRRIGSHGSDEVLPYIVVTVPDEARRAAVTRLVTRLEDRAGEWIKVSTFADAPALMAAEMRAPERAPKSDVRESERHDHDEETERPRQTATFHEWMAQQGLVEDGGPLGSADADRAPFAG